ncbi:MAG: hypothetical protein ACYC1U_09405 [Candidatus Aquicultorales bacterium]
MKLTKRQLYYLLPLLLMAISVFVVAAVATRSGSKPEVSPETYDRREPASDDNDAYRPVLGEILPGSLGTYQKLESLTGEEAMAATRDLHRGKVREADEALVARYADDTKVWITLYGKEEIAGEELEKMRQAMVRFGGGFETLSKASVGGAEIYVTKPGGITQYFWKTEGFLSYVSPGSASQADTERFIKEIEVKLKDLWDTSSSGKN